MTFTWLRPDRRGLPSHLAGMLALAAIPVLLVLALVAPASGAGGTLQVPTSTEADPSTDVIEPLDDDPFVEARTAPESALWAPFVGTVQLWCTDGNVNPLFPGHCVSHHGYAAMDIGDTAGEIIYAAGPGFVADMSWCSCDARGRYVTLLHPDGRDSRYLHMDDIYVEAGEPVVAGQPLGTVGATGVATGPHLHYDEGLSGRIDPGPMLACHGDQLVSYPDVLGFNSWFVTPFGTYLRNDGYDCLRGGPTYFCANKLATIVGTSGPDRLLGTDGRDVIVGLDGDDIIEGTGGNDVVCAGDGDDRVLGGPGRDELYGQRGADYLRGDANDDTILGGDGDDVLVGAIGSDDLRGGNGGDVLRGGAKNDLLVGGRGKDVLRAGPGDDRVHGLWGRDRLYGGTGADHMWGGSANDQLWGEGGADVLWGGGDADVLTGGPGPDILRGGPGRDILWGGAGGDTLYGGDANDKHFGEGDDDLLFGGAGNDQHDGGAGYDVCRGGVLVGCE